MAQSSDFEDPSNSLFELLKSNRLESIYSKFIQYNVDLDYEHLMDVEPSDLEKLCNELHLTASERIKFKKCVKKIEINKSNNYDHKFKIILVGDSETGKTSIIKRFAYNQFDYHQLSTIGIDFISRYVETPSGSKIKLVIWDTCGQEKFNAINLGYYRGADCIIIVYDITNQNSFNNISTRWISQINNSSIFNNKNINTKPYIVLVGNKIDKLIDEKNDENENENKNVNDDLLMSIEPNLSNMVSQQEAMNLLSKNSWHSFYQVSAKSGHHIQSLFVTCATAVLLKKQGLNFTNVNMNIQQPQNYPFNIDNKSDIDSSLSSMDEIINLTDVLLESTDGKQEEYSTNCCG